MDNKEHLMCILDMGYGAIKERADFELSKIVENIIDPNTNATKTRTLTIQMKITPDTERQNLKVETVVKSKLEPTNPITTPMYIASDGNGEMCIVEMTPQLPGQISIDGGEQEQPGIIKLRKQA